jgi:hypothetical protein
MFQNERGPRRRGRNQSRTKAERLAQFHGRGLLHEDGIGASLDGEAVRVLCEDEPAKPRRRFEQLKGNAPHGQLVRGRKPGDSAANDRDHAL